MYGFYIGAIKVKGGLTTGFVYVSSDGYVYMMTNCDQPGQLDDTYAALGAIQLKPFD